MFSSGSRLALLALATSVLVRAQGTFESTDFNATKALVDLGINVTALPDLAQLRERSSTAGCSIAVSVTSSNIPTTF
jgi:hypothetical protein